MHTTDKSQVSQVSQVTLDPNVNEDSCLYIQYADGKITGHTVIEFEYKMSLSEPFNMRALIISDNDALFSIGNPAALNATLKINDPKFTAPICIAGHIYEVW